MNISEMRVLLDSKKISTQELLAEYLTKINENKSLNCYITVCEDYAIKCAEKAQKLILSGSSGALTGIPIAIKDNICTRGIKTTCASKMLKDFIPQYSSTAVLKLENDGYILLGKTNMDEFAMGSTSQNSFFGAVKNPTDNSKVSGGSSGGSAAAVAAGLCTVALGSDTGGSVRQPAAFCGVSALKPTYGRVSRSGLISFAPSLDQIGIIGNSVSDIAIVLNVISGYDASDMTSQASTPVSLQPRQAKIGLPKEFLSCSENAPAIISAAKNFERLGFEIRECSVPCLEYALPAYYIISSAEAASNLSRFDGVKYGYRTEADSFDDLIKGSRSNGFSTEVKRRIMLGNYVLSTGHFDKLYMRAQQIRNALKAEFARLFELYDYIITPTTVSSAPNIDASYKTADIYRSDILTVAQNLAGLPCINIPSGYSAGMSITGRHFDEDGLLFLAGIYEKECGV